VEEIKKIGEPPNENVLGEEDFGYLIWKLKSLEEFVPCYKTMIEKTDDE